jgi:diguanylate cyclase (GGDEF)-like protein
VAEELYARLRAAERLASMHRDLVQLASLDSLTGILNRRAFFERAEEARDQALRSGPLTTIMLDVDHFKRVNDLYGHAVGDRALREVGSLVSNTGEIVGRLGGEEFSVLLSGRDLAQGMEAAERLRGEVLSLRLPVDGKVLTLTCSFGVSEWQNGESVDELLRRADMALYAAKAAGRNRVVAADEALAIEDYDGTGRTVRAAPRDSETVAPQAEPAPARPRPAA